MEEGSGEEFWVEESREQQAIQLKTKRRVKPKKMEFDGWGSKPLIEFLQDFGKETEKQLSEKELTAIVIEYATKNNLIKPEKKKRVHCDQKLHYLFGRKWVPRIKIPDFLEQHLAENHDESSEDEKSNSFEEEENDIKTSRKRKASSLGKKVVTHPVKKVPETPKSCFAAIIPENIKLVYMKRTLVQELLKDSEHFESKVVGSYVRIRSDPNDYSQKNSHQLLEVTGVRRASECGDTGAEIFLQVPNLIKEIKISMLSDENFSKEECDDLLRRIKAGSIKRPTVVELQEKCQILHEDITKQWIVKELSLLQNLIDRANEKGWRRELFDYLERKQLLQKPSEQARLLLEVPKVIAEELEREVTQQDPGDDVKQEHSSSPKSINKSPDAKNRSINGPKVGAEKLVTETILQDPVDDSEDGRSPKSIIRGNSSTSFEDKGDQTLSNHNFSGADSAGPGDATVPSQVTLFGSYVGGEGNEAYINGTMSVKKTDEDQPDNSVLQQKQALPDMSSRGLAEVLTKPQLIGLVQHQLVNTEKKKEKPIDLQETGLSTETAAKVHQLMNNLGTGSRGISQKITAPQVIELSDDDEEEDKRQTCQFPIVDHRHTVEWYYKDPQNKTQGPFAMSSIKQWKESNYFPPGFMVWKKGHREVLLDEVIREMFYT